MDTLRFHVRGADLHALVFGEPDAPDTILAAHGLTASAMSFRAIAHRLPPGRRLVALDLRGRGGSAGQPGPFGIDTHAADLIAVARRLGGRLALAGHSMGAYAALRAAAERPELFTRLVLIDGGLPAPLPPGVSCGDLVEYTVAPTVARLGRTFATEDAYLDFYRRQPALARDWSPDVEAYVRYDMTGPPGAVRSRIDVAAVRADIADLLANAGIVAADLTGLTVPAHLVYASAGMLGRSPGMLPRGEVDDWAAKVPALSARLIEGVNHYTIVVIEPAVTMIADLLTSPDVSAT